MGEKHTLDWISILGHTCKVYIWKFMSRLVDLRLRWRSRSFSRPPIAINCVVPWHRRLCVQFSTKLTPVRLWKVILSQSLCLWDQRRLPPPPKDFGVRFEEAWEGTHWRPYLLNLTNYWYSRPLHPAPETMDGRWHFISSFASSFLAFSRNSWKQGNNCCFWKKRGEKYHHLMKSSWCLESSSFNMMVS